MNNLVQMANGYDTDKPTHYLKNYEAFFSGLADKRIHLLELGVRGGGSLLLWRDYFPQGVIVGLDIDPVQIDDASGRIFTYQGAQEDTALLDRIALEIAPDGFDVIIDDCSHIGVLARASFWHLFDHHLKSGGVYVIEDWGTGYWASWIDGVGYKPHAEGYSPVLYRLTRIIARLQRSPATKWIPLAVPVLARVKATIVRRQYHSHDYGMVGFIKELIDEVGMNDIMHPEFGLASQRVSKIQEMKIAQSQLFVIKA